MDDKDLEESILSDPSVLNKDRPWSNEAERGIISCCLHNSDYIDKLIEAKGANYYYHDCNKIIIDAIILLYNKGVPTDNPIVLVNHLREINKLDKIGGPAELSELFSEYLTHSHFPYFLKILEDKYKLRRIIDVSARNIFLAQRYSTSGGEPIDDFITKYEDDILSLRSEESKDFTKAGNEVLNVIDEIQESINNPGKIFGLETGYKKLDYLTGGLKPTEYFIIAARPSEGKTSLLLNIIENLAFNEEKNCVIFTLEVSKKLLVKKLICTMAGLSMTDVSAGQLTRLHQDGLARALRKIQTSNINIDDTSSIDIDMLCSKSRRLHKKTPIDVIAIDYIQLITCKKAGNRENEISQISAKIKGLAKELNIPIIVLAQLNRSVESRKKRRPILSDLRESGSIEQDADLVGLLTRTGYFGNREQSDDEIIDEKEACLILAKNRNGPTDDVPLQFHKEITRFTEPN